MAALSAPLPAVRTTGGTSTADPAADVNQLRAAVLELAGRTTPVSLTQAAYDALATKDPATLYLITG